MWNRLRAALQRWVLRTRYGRPDSSIRGADLAALEAASIQLPPVSITADSPAICIPSIFATESPMPPELWRYTVSGIRRYTVSGIRAADAPPIARFIARSTAIVACAVYSNGRWKCHACGEGSKDMAWGHTHVKACYAVSAA